MASQRFDLIKTLPKQTHKLERLTSIESCKSVVESYITGQNDDSKRQTLANDGRQRASETSSITPSWRLPNANNLKNFSDRLSQDGTEHRQNARRKTVIVVEEHGEDKKNGSVAPVLNDKGYSRIAQLSVLYATMLGLVGVVFPITEALNEQWLSSHIVGVFLAYLHLGGSLFILYIEIYERVLRRRHKGSAHESGASSGVNNNYGIDVVYDAETISGVLPDIAETDAALTDEVNSDAQSGVSSLNDDKLPETNTKTSCDVKRDVLRQISTHSMYDVDSDLPDDVYDYITMHHGTATIASFDTNYFVKCGMMLFAVANMVYVALRIEGEYRKKVCSDVLDIIYPHYMHLGFIIMQTFFLSKECKLALRKHKPFVNFGLMHLVATNMCVWFRYLVIEVSESIHEADSHADTANGYDGANNKTNSCMTQPLMIKAGPYLFPFILEYSLVAMTTLIVVYRNINLRVTRELYRSICLALDKKRIDSTKRVKSVNSDLSDGGAFDKSHKGLMFGGIVLAGVIVSMILFFYWKGNGEERNAQMCYTISEIIILGLISINNVVGMYRLFSFLFNAANSNTLDHALLLISANFLLILEVFSLLSVIFDVSENDADGLMVAEVMEPIISILQAVLQVAFINDGMQRVSVKDEELHQKKGRNIITFLIVLNVAMWLFESFQEKKSDQTEEIEVYGNMAWAIIDSVAHPLELFFYFHSAICLSHMWHHCYKKPESNVLGNNVL